MGSQCVNYTYKIDGELNILQSCLFTNILITLSTLKLMVCCIMRIRAESLDVSMEFWGYVFVCRSVEKLRSASQLVIGSTQAIHNRVYILGNSSLLTALIAVTNASGISFSASTLLCQNNFHLNISF